MKYYFPIHLNGGNRGCEAIAQGSAILIGESSDKLFGYCNNVSLDTMLGLPKYLTLIPFRIKSYYFDRFLAAINKLFSTSQTKEWRLLYPYKCFLQMITKDDLVLFTGGDKLCYDDNEIIYINNWLHAKSIKTILWGCSMGPEDQTDEKLKTLRKFTLIYARESLTYDYLKSIGLSSLHLLPDPAFILEPEPCELPNFFSRGKIIGINISNYVMGGMTLDSQFGREVLYMIDYIIKQTNLNILFIPHVTWNDPKENQDDRKMATIICNYFDNNNKLCILDIDRLNYCKIRHIISKCSMFIGARTHAVISAYATCVPTIALGYSIKSRGIAKDLGLDKRLVVNSRNFTERDLIRSLKYMMKNETNIRTHLQKIMPDYKQRAYQIRRILKQQFY